MTAVAEQVQVLVADDEPLIRSFFDALFEERSDCDVHFAEDGQDAYRKLASVQPDLLITDLNMPRMTGQELTELALRIQPDLTIVVETGNPTVEGAVDLMRQGVLDFITKPFDMEELTQRINSAIDTSRSRRKARSVDAIVDSFLAALHAKDPYLREHSIRVGLRARSLGKDLGLVGEELENLAWAGLVHDVGKIGTPEYILHKPGKLTDEEFGEMKRHPVYSAEIIEPLAHMKGGESTVRAVYHHHERIDGRGYPDGIAGDEIPMFSRIISVSDTYDALASARPYRGVVEDKKVIEILEDAKGTQLESEFVDVFVSNLESYNDVVAGRRDL